MRHWVSLLLACTLVGVALGEEIDTTGLSQEQKAEIALQVARLKNKQPIESLKVYQGYVEVGQAIGQALASSAKELGVQVNEFSKTPVGMITTGLIVWKCIGREILHFVCGGLFLAICTGFWIHFYRRMCIIKSVEYGQGFWLFRSKKVAYYDTGGQTQTNLADTRWSMFITFCIILLVGIIMMWT